MARIRSVHPGLFTDEAFVSCSALARLLVIGLWTEADDQGVFEWKPVTLKMRILPVDNADVPAILAELETANLIRRFTVEGRQYGAVRNFCKFQRPKKPNSVHPLPSEFRTYVGSKAVSSEPIPPVTTLSGEPANDDAPPVPQKGEIAPQMEDGGWRGEEKEEEKGGGRAGARSGSYAFDGQVIRLNRADYNRWKAAYRAIPDFDAELNSLDAFYASEPKAKLGNWFVRASTALNNKHQEHLARRPPTNDAAPRPQADPKTNPQWANY